MQHDCEENCVCTRQKWRVRPRIPLRGHFSIVLESLSEGWILHARPFFRELLGDAYRRLRGGAFAEWRLSVEGRVATPRTFSLDELKHLSSRTQITRHVCEEGWSAIAEWTGTPLRLVLEGAGILPTARFVLFYSYDDSFESIDMLDALHPQTILAYNMNGRDLLIPHGAPARLRVETQLGQKSIKYLQRIVVTDEFDDGGKKGSIQTGWAWYMGI